MHRTDYPQLIASAATQLADLEAEISQLRLAILQQETQADLETAFDPNLKNDAQRRARHAELTHANPVLIDLRQTLIEHTRSRALLQAQIEQLRQEFAIYQEIPELPEISAQPQERYFTLTIDPSAAHTWQQLDLRDSLTQAPPSLAGTIADHLHHAPGSYLLAIGLSVRVLTQQKLSPPPDSLPADAMSQAPMPIVAF